MTEANILANILANISMLKQINQYNIMQQTWTA